MNVIASAKRYVSEDRYRLRLFETVDDEVHRVAAQLREQRCGVTAEWSGEALWGRLATCDQIVADLCRVEAIVCRWGTRASLESATLAVTRLCSEIEAGGGRIGWDASQWYPVLRIVYAGGVAAVAGGRYDALRALTHVSVQAAHEGGGLVTAMTAESGDGTKAFKLLPDLERHYVSCSDYLHATLEPLLIDVLFLGSDFERAFDRFELLYAIEWAHVMGLVWAPIGRFGFKEIRSDSSPLARILREAGLAGDAWPPLAAGLCGGSIDRFKAIAAWLMLHVERAAKW